MKLQAGLLAVIAVLLVIAVVLWVALERRGARVEQPYPWAGTTLDNRDRRINELECKVHFLQYGDNGGLCP